MQFYLRLEQMNDFLPSVWLSTQHTSHYSVILLTFHSKVNIVNKYCEWLTFRGVLIFVVFVEGPIHEFQYPRNGNFLYHLWKKMLWPRNLNPTNASILFNPRKLVPMKIKPSTVFHFTLDQLTSVMDFPSLMQHILHHITMPIYLEVAYLFHGLPKHHCNCI